MKKWFVLLLTSFCGWTFAMPIENHKIDPKALCELTSILGIPEDADLVTETQKRWLRKPNQERWEMNELSSDQRLFVLNWAQKNGLSDPWKPLSSNYDKALILGATTSRMQMRLDYLIQLWNEGTRFHEVVWLTGERPLDPRVDGLTDRCTNEAEAAHILWEEASIPEEMRSLPVVFIAAPMKIEGTSRKRPNTEDTIVAWLKVCEHPCKALFVSDQPFCGYQFAVIKANMPDPFLFDVAGQGVDLNNHPSGAALTLDSIARWIYQENLITKSEK
jgi:hypothetical protein